MQFATKDEMYEWLRRRAEVIKSLPPAATAVHEAGRIALERHQREGLPLRGHKEFCSHDAVVSGVRGALHMGTQDYGGEFDVAGERWVAVSHVEYGTKRRTTIVSAMRRCEVEALFAAGVHIDPNKAKANKGMEELKQKISDLTEYGLSREAYEVAGALAQRLINAGKSTPEQAEQLIGDKFLHYVSGLMRSADTWTYSSHLHPDNGTSRQVFERMTGAFLPKTIKGTKALLESGVTPAGYRKGAIRDLPPCREAVATICATLAGGIESMAASRDKQMLNVHYTEDLERRAVFADAAIRKFLDTVGKESWVVGAADDVASILKEVKAVNALNPRTDDRTAFSEAGTELIVLAQRLRISLNDENPEPAGPRF